MSEAIPEDLMEKAREAGIALRFGLAECHLGAARELWATTDAIELVNAAFASAILAERKETIERCAKVAERYFTGMFTGWIGYSSESLITLDEAEGAAVECGPICAAAIRSLGRE